ncbi:MAG: NADH-quinone oxidoreductase subunit C [Bacteroidota bacterium]|jgi:NADH-quinone oxidoreductase subunit C|nr:NADH-quinone oxidoreductase subunit C [Ignavibacteria bacterium]MCU7497755.1 NADH-quinone oxidoreductase subunit C [Ignavibacteria bacterium]MCU7510940.1 NADH-quinone oxidoreductase subunit C [Ignavibacteria bacterium]MCU7518793.1 NADH-quinone oxidoreductase subunit C [Ignavibacteria bacterium]MCU7523237.1 NADH-quinone oxidoreductase subunit C [Ignavibacteria bacterium]
MELKEVIIEKLNGTLKGAVLEVTDFRGDLCLTVAADKIIDVCTFLKSDNDLEFNMCEDVTAIDWAKRKMRFTMVYHIYSLKNKFRLRLKVNLEGETAHSVSSVWASANWYERETFDMFGIKFTGHPDLRRVYMPEEFEYHPLRKEFPLLGIPGSIPLPKK